MAGTGLNIGALASALVPSLAVLLLGYWAGRHHNFDADQAAGLSTLALNFALPAALFVGMTKVTRSQLAAQLPLLLALLCCYVVTYLGAYLLARRSKALGARGAAVTAALVSFPAAPVYGTAVLTPLFGASSVVTVGLVALICNLVITPITLVLLERSGGQAQAGAHAPGVGALLVRSLASPLVWAPLLGLGVALVGLRLPGLLDQTLDLLGVSSSGVAIFASGLVLAAHHVRLSGSVWGMSFGKVIVEPALLLGLLLLLRVHGTTAAAGLVGTALPSAVLGVLLAAKYKTAEGAAASTLVVTSVAIVGVLPLALWASSLLK